VARDDVAVHEQDFLFAADLEDRGQVDRDRGLAHPTLGIEHDDDPSTAATIHVAAQ
jgi:hypothetical protein